MVAPSPVEFAIELDAARRAGTVLDTLLTDRGLDSLPVAYEVQRELTRLRITRGQKVIGWKLGYTSAAMRAQMGIAQPNYGPLTDVMLLGDGAKVPTAALQPRVEPEIALVLDRSLRPGEDVLAACRSAHACLEVVDSIWRDYRFTLLDNTADGSSAGWFVLGPQLPLEALDLVEVQLRLGDDVVATATGAAAGGHPANGVRWLATQLAERGDTLRAGDVVITGGLTTAAPVRPGDVVSARFGRAVAVSVSR